MTAASQKSGAATSAGSSDSEYIIVKSEYKLVQIPVADILYIEGLKDYVKIYTADSDRSIMTLMSMKTLEQHLPADRFMRVHRSFIVNTARIKVIERTRIVFGKNYIPVSESYKQAFSDFIAVAPSRRTGIASRIKSASARSVKTAAEALFISQSNCQNLTDASVGPTLIETSPLATSALPNENSPESSSSVAG